MVQMVGDRHIVAKIFLVQCRIWLPKVDVTVGANASEGEFITGAVN